jgi:hypothetical protein
MKLIYSYSAAGLGTDPTGRAEIPSTSLCTVFTVRALGTRHSPGSELRPVPLASLTSPTDGVELASSSGQRHSHGKEAGNYRLE